MANILKQLIRKITEARFKPRDFATKDFVIMPETGTTIEDIMRPEYFCHVAKQLAIGNKIEVIADDMSFYARLLVVGVTNLSAKVFVLEYHDLADAEKSASVPGLVTSEDYEIVFRGVHSKWSVVQKDGGKVLFEGLDDRRSAERELVGYLKTLAA